MKKLITSIVLPLAFVTSLVAAEQPTLPTADTNSIVFRELRYDAKVTDDEARFAVELLAESSAKTGATTLLFDGELALLPPKLPDGLRVEREGNVYRLFIPKPGKFQFKLDLVAKINRVEPWNHVTFKGPLAAIAAVTAQAAGADVDLQLLSGTVVESGQTNGVSRVRGFLGAEQTLALRWQSRAAEVARKVVVAAESTVTALITPTVVKYTTQFRYEVIQGKLSKLTVALPANHALTRLVGDQIRDWSVAPEDGKQMLTVEFIKPIEKTYQLTVLSEQTIETTPATVSLLPPQPIDAERESGSITISAEDMQAEIDSATGLRQVNATGGSLAAYRFSARPFALALRLKRIEPVVTANDRATARLEETRLLVAHALTLEVEKAGIYQIELQPQPGFVVADVRGEGVEDWKVADGKLRVSFTNRVLGSRRLDVQLEQPLKEFAQQIVVQPLHVTGAAKEMAQLGAASAPGIQLKTAELVGLREIPVNRLPARTDELLAFTADAADWKLSLSAERLAARVVAEIFNLVTIGDGLVGGSATIRYGLINQGVQEFRVQVPAHWKNVEFTGPNIRRKEVTTGADTNSVTWTIGLQDKAWGGYTLVVTYDYQFEPQGATLPVAGIHALDVERETGSVAITTAASLKLSAKAIADPLRRVDEAELAVADRALISRSVLLAYQYTGDRYDLSVDVKRYAEASVLSAVADRTQLTSVLTEAGELLTQASFMVKNNDKQFQRFLLPTNANFWNCYVNDQPAKPERDGDWLLVPLPRGVNRDEAFAVDIVYAEKKAALKSRWSQALQLAAPQTDVPNTYAEWQLYVPASQRVAGFGGSMNVVEGTTYGVWDAWRQFLVFYRDVLREIGPGYFALGFLAILVVSLVVSAVRRGWNGVLTFLVVVGIAAVLGAMMLPALAKAKSRAQRISSVNNLKQIALAAMQYALENNDRFPTSYADMINELNTLKVTIDPESGQPYVFLGNGLPQGSLSPQSVLAYSPIVNGRCNVALVDGSVQQLTAAKFAELTTRGLILFNSPAEAAALAQRQAVMGQQQAASPIPATALPATTAKAGPRAIRIELPLTGNAFTFTKVLNVRDEPLRISAGVMSLASFQQRQMAVQVAAFVAGLVAWWWQWRSRRNSFVLTLALVLMLGSISSLLIAWRALHDALIIGIPGVLVAAVAWLIWKFWPRGAASEPAPEISGSPEIPPAVAAILLALGFAFGTTANAAESQIGNVSIRSASYTGSVNERVAQLDAVIQVSAAQAGQRINLFGEDVAVQSFTAKPGDAKILRDGNTVSVQLPRKGEATLQLKLLVRLSGDVAKRQLAFGIPAALTSKLALTIDQPDADVEFPGAISFKRETATQRTRLDALIGASGRVEISWTPRVKRAAEVAATVMCQNATLVSFGGGVMSARSVLDYQVTQGELRSARVRLPAGHRLLRVEGESIRNWSSKEEGGEMVLLVELLKGVTPNYRLTVETEKSLDALPATAKVETPHALDVKRETGLMALRGEDELELTVSRADELQRIDPAAFAATPIGQGVTGITSAFRFLKTDFALETRVAALQPQVEAVVRNHLRAGDEQLHLSATVDYVIKRAGVFALKLAVPEGFRIESVNGTNVLQHSERNADGQRVLEVALKERTLGTYSLRVELVKNVKPLPKTLAVVGVQPLGTDKLAGFVSVSAEAGVAVKTASFGGLTEIPVTALPSGNPVTADSSALAFKFLAAESGTAPDWKLSVTTETVESWVRAEVAATLTVSDTLVTGHALVRYDIQNAPVKELRLRLPTALKNVEITGANIRRRDQSGESWRVELQNKVRGAYTLTVTWDQPRSAGTNLVELANLTVEGVERETGTMAVVAKSPLQVTESRAADLLKLDAREWPEWAGQPEASTALAYRYLRPGYQLAVEARRFAEAEVLQALAETFHLTTVVADDGQMMTTVSVALRNNGRQHLEVVLPAGATVWSAFVAGQAVKPSLREGKLLLPLENAGSDDAALAVELTYVATNQFPTSNGKVNLISPTLDVPLKGARWEVYLPTDYRYDEFVGTMSRETGAAAEASSFSYLEYSQKESAAKAEAQKGLKSEISNAKKMLAEGNVKEAQSFYNRYGLRSGRNENKDAETRQVEAELRRAQASNLVQAQQAFTFANNSLIVSGQLPQQQQRAELNVNYDNAAAEQQWDKLQQAQEIGVAKVRPLRVNLPTRGLRHVFGQVLQTETGKAMTVSFAAANTKSVSWPKRVSGGLVGFVALWAVVALVSGRAGRK